MALSLGGAIEYQYSGFENIVSPQTLCMYFSCHTNDNFAIYTSPKFIHQFVSDDESSFFPAGNIGLYKRINERFSIIGKASSFYAFDSGLIYNGGLGITFNLK